MRRKKVKRVLSCFLSFVMFFVLSVNTALAAAVPEKAAEAGSQERAVVMGSIVNIDFSDYTFLASTATKVTLDNSFLGRVDLAVGKTQAELVESDGRKVLKLNANGADIKSFKSGLNITKRIGIEFKVKFGDTSSSRQFFECKGLLGEDKESYSWPTLLEFDAKGQIKDSAKKSLGSYQAGIWYTVKLDMDTPNQKYKVTIEGGESVLTGEASLNVGGSGGIWRGIRESKAFTQKNGAKGTDNFMEIAYVKAGEHVDGIEEFLYEDLNMETGQGKVIMPAVTPADVFTDKIAYTSSDPSVVKVFANGLLALKPGTVTVSVKDEYAGAEGSFKVKVTETLHQWDYKEVSVELLNQAIWSGYRAELDYPVKQLKELFYNTFKQKPEYYRDMNDQTFIEDVKKDFETVKNPTNLQANKYEKMTRYLTLMYRLTDDWGYARKAAMILYYQAQEYPRVLLKKELADFPFKESEMIFGGNLVFTFGYLLNAKEDGVSVWDSIKPEGVTQEEVLSVISELYLRPLADNCMDRMMKRPDGLNNIDGYGSRPTAVLANILNDPYLIRKVVAMCDAMLSNEHYYFDGMWEEGTLSYGSQVVNNLLSCVLAIANYEDPADYEDPLNPAEYGLTENVLGLELAKTDLKSRWVLADKTVGLPRVMVYPNGSAIAINDTHFDKSLEVRPIRQELLKNVEMPALGYYGLVRGNEENAVHAGLAYQARQRGFAGSHDHVNVLSMMLWGANQELLPDPGYVAATTYPTGGATLRYPSMRPVFHNMPWIFQQNGNNEQASLEWSKPRLLSYDDGSKIDGLLSLVEASEVGPDFAQVDVNQRLLMNIDLDENHSYVFDLSRMKGGEAHELFQRGTELENMDVSANDIVLEDMGVASLIEAEPFASYKTSGLVQDMVQLKNPSVGDTSSDFSFTWKGQESGSRITTYMNGVADSKLYLSSLPTARRMTCTEDAASYYTPHVTRYREADENTVTSYGAVHEPASPGESDFIKEVKWSSLEGDDMGVFAKVTSELYVDYIYISSDMTERTLEGIPFAGRTAFVRTDLQTGKVLHSYVYGEGKAGKAVGTAAQVLKVTDLQSADWMIRNQEASQENTITVSGKIQNADEFIGRRGILKFGDNSGYGVKITGIREEADSTVVTIEEFSPARKTENGVITQFFPYDIVIEGDAYLILESPVSAKEISGDKTQLQESVVKAGEFNSEDYTQDSFSALWDALERAKAVLEDAQASQVTIDEALGNLNQAIENLVKKTDVSGGDISGGDVSAGDRWELQEAVNKAGVLDGSNYTADSFEVLLSALAAAKEVLADENASKEAIAKALANLNQAIAQLKEKPEAPEIPDVPVVVPDGGNGGSDEVPKVDWNQVMIEITNQVKSQLSGKKDQGSLTESPVINLVTGNSIQVPAATLKAFYNQNLTVAFHTGKGVTFSINGKQMTEKSAGKGVDLSILTEKDSISPEVVRTKTAGAFFSRQISMASKESFGMTVNLHLALGAENRDRYANLYSYDQQKKSLEYKGSFKITKNGQAMFGILKGADYLVTVTDTVPKEAAAGTYVIKKGDTLSKIAAKNNKTLKDLILSNPGIQNQDKIRAGQKIVIQ